MLNRGVILTLLLLALVSGSVWGQEVVHVFTKYDKQVITDDQKGTWKTSVASTTSNELPADFSATSAKSRGVAFGANAEVTSDFVVENISELIIEASSNERGNSLSVKVGDVELSPKTSTLPKVNHETYSFKSSEPLSGQITISIQRSKKTVWIGGVTIKSSGSANQVRMPVFTPVTGSLFKDKLTVTASSPTEGATIYYTKDGAEPTTGSDKFPTEGVTLTETTTLKAIAVKDGLDNSEVVTATYTKLEPYTSLKALKESGIATAEGVTCFVELKDAVVTYADSRKAYIQDETAGLYVFGSNNLKVGTKLNGVVSAQLALYNGLYELKVEGGEFDNVEVTEGVEIPVQVVTVAESLIIKATTNSTSPVIYSSEDEEIAKVDSEGKVQAGNKAGTVTITASVAENDEFTGATATCIVNVVDPAAQPKPQALVAKSKGLYYVMKAEEGSANNSLAAEQVEILNNRVVNVGLQNILWNISEDKTIITTPDGKYLTGKDGETDLTIETVKFTWTWSEADNAWLNGNRSFVYSTSGYFKHYATSNIGKSGYADGYTVAMPIVDGYVRNVASGDYGTICLPYTVAAEDMVGADFFSVAGKVMKEGQPQSIVLEQVTTLEAGVPYIFSATSDKLIVAYSGKAVAVAGGANGLMGSFEGQDVSEGMYLLTNNTVKKVGSAGGHIGANRAYFNMDEMPEYIGTVGVNQRVISLDGVTAIDGVEAGNPKMVDVYTLSGVKVKSQVPFAEVTQGLAKGIYVVNAKKVVVE